MAIAATAKLIKDFFGVKIPQWWNDTTQEFVEVSNVNPMPVGVTSTRSVTSGTLINGTAVIVPMLTANYPATVWVNAVAGDTVAVSYSVDNEVTYTAWPNGSIVGAATSNDTMNSPITHLKFQRTAGAGVTSTYGVI